MLILLLGTFLALSRHHLPVESWYSRSRRNKEETFKSHVYGKVQEEHTQPVLTKNILFVY